MDYEDMSFSEQDKAQLIANRDAICGWIKENILPRLSSYERLIIDFGDDYMGLRSYEKTKMFHFSVFGEENTFFTGGGTRTRGQIAIGFKYSTISTAFDCTQSPYEIFPFIKNWKWIKRELLSQVDKKEKNKEAIYSFEI